MTEDLKTGWWGGYTLDAGAGAYWAVGGFEMWARRSDREWEVSTLRGDDPAAEARVIEVPTSREAPEDGVLRRFAFRRTQPDIRILPACADRGMVIRPDVTFFIPPGEESTLYISTPLWMTVYLGTSSPVMDVPCYRPSDTWFGPDTRVGEMCYASRTRATQDLSRVTRLPHRAISVVNIHNRAATPLQFERIMLPVPYLSLYSDGAGYVWTEPVTLERGHDGDLADMRLGRGAPDVVDPKADLVSGPRRRHEKGLRMFGLLLK